MSIFNKYGPKGRQPEYLEVDENDEIVMLQKRIQEEAPESGSQLRRYTTALSSQGWALFEPNHRQ
jgi:hypothetical protein